MTLRQYHLSDIDVFMEWARNPDVLCYRRLQHWLQPSREDFVSYFEQAVIPRPWYRAIGFDEHTIGFICIELAGTEKWSRGRALLSFGLERYYWGRGIATSAIREAVSAAFREIHGLVRIEAVVHPDNKASQHGLEKLGFSNEGLLRKYLILNGEGVDHIVYSILFTDSADSVGM